MNLTNQFMVLEWKPRWIESYMLCQLFSSDIHLSFPPHINLLFNNKPNSLFLFARCERVLCRMTPRLVYNSVALLSSFLSWSLRLKLSARGGGATAPAIGDSPRPTKPFTNLSRSPPPPGEGAITSVSGSCVAIEWRDASLKTS